MGNTGVKNLTSPSLIKGVHMAGPLNEFTQVTKFVAETFGEPGRRTFLINVDSGSSNAKIWLEKEQLAELSIAMVQMDRETQTSGGISEPPPEGIEAKGLTNLDFKASRLAFGHNPDTNLFIVDAHDPDDQNDEPTVRIWLSREIIKTFAKQGLEIVSAGRPLCQLCGNPINSNGHYCERRNGHSLQGDSLI